MITYHEGDIFDSNCYALVNPVNCVGVMGKGLALHFKHRYPDNYKMYKSFCDSDDSGDWTGSVFMWGMGSNKVIINFPTKNNWRDKSLLSYISDGLDNMLHRICLYDIDSVAIPALGCGLGGLDWDDVNSIFVDKLSNHPYVRFEIYPPK